MINDAPLITCVIATYRRPQLLQRAIYSVLNQTFKKVVVFVTDNASGDETATVVRAIQAKDSRVFYHCHPENLGMHANWTYGLSQVKTTFYSILNDDDVLMPELYEMALAEFDKFPKAMMVASKVPYVSERGNFIKEQLSCWQRYGLFDPPEAAFQVAAYAHPEIIGIVFKKALLETPYGFPKANMHGADYEIIFKTCLNYQIVTIDYEGALFVQHGGPRAEPDSIALEIVNYCNWINEVEVDSRFPEYIKAASRSKFLGPISFLLLRLALHGERNVFCDILKLVINYYGELRLFSKLNSINKICSYSDLMRFILLKIITLRNSSRTMLRPNKKYKYSNALRLCK